MALRSTPERTRSYKGLFVGGGVLFALLLFMLLVSGSFSRVDSTEHCVLTRYGTVIKRKMPTGLNFTPLSDPTCFRMTQRNFPEGEGGKEVIQATTADPVTVEGDVAITWSYNPGTIYQVFLDKRTPEAAETEVLNAVREGYRNALNAWTVNRIFSAERARLSDDVRRQIQAKLGNRATIHQVFVREIRIPPQIEQARIEAARQAQVLDRAQKQFTIDSVNARAQLLKAEADARAKELEARSYAANPALLQLEAAKAMSNGLAQACRGVQTCVIGGSVMDTWQRPVP
ncbi:MAG TPA: SPFH domain-containing protein [Longimicrobium sp.]|nr:SPFH domain-containing protein [Longimicrobium sp.]